MEHLAHVVYGLQDLKVGKPTNAEYCQNFYRDCPNSLCK